MLNDLFEIFQTKKHLEDVFEDSKLEQIRAMIISKIEEDLRETVEENFLTLRSVHNFLKCLVSLNEVNERRIENAELDGLEFLPSNLARLKAPFIVLEMSIHHQCGHLLNPVYQGTYGGKEFLIVFNRKLDVSYIHRSLVDEDVENVFIYLKNGQKPYRT